MRFLVGADAARRAAMVAVAFMACASTVAHAELDAQTRAKADGWVGRDAGDLLKQLRVDGGRVQIAEDDATLETRYTWSTRDEAWVEKIKIGGGQFLHTESTGNGTRPVFAPIIYDHLDHPAEHRCDITYVADRDGIVRRWTHDGPRCDTDIVGPSSRR